MRLRRGTWWFAGRRCSVWELYFAIIVSVVLDLVRLSGRSGRSFVEAELDDHYHYQSCDYGSNNQGDQQCDNHCNGNCNEANRIMMAGSDTDTAHMH